MRVGRWRDNSSLDGTPVGMCGGGDISYFLTLCFLFLLFLDSAIFHSFSLVSSSSLASTCGGSVISVSSTSLVSGSVGMEGSLS